MNILDKVKDVLIAKNVPSPFLGFLPDKPAECTALYEYNPAPPEHHFGRTDFIYGVQARCRAFEAAAAFATAEAIITALNRYHDGEISVVAKTPILDIGRDNSNPQNQEYTVNFEVRRLK